MSNVRRCSGRKFLNWNHTHEISWGIVRKTKEEIERNWLAWVRKLGETWILHNGKEEHNFHYSDTPTGSEHPSTLEVSASQMEVWPSQEAHVFLMRWTQILYLSTPKLLYGQSRSSHTRSGQGSSQSNILSLTIARIRCFRGRLKKPPIQGAICSCCLSVSSWFIASKHEGSPFLIHLSYLT